MAVGYIYVLSNPAHPELLKIGYTSGHVRERAAELSSTTGVPGPFEVEFFHITADVEEVERLIHLELQASRPNAGREFFRLPLLDAIQAVEKFVRRPEERYARETPPISTGTVYLKQCARCGHRFERTVEYRYCPSCGF